MSRWLLVHLLGDIMSTFQKWSLTFIAMCAFAGNSVLCRWALADTQIDPASFTTIRLVSGAMFLGVLTLMLKPNFIQVSDAAPALSKRSLTLSGSWLGALALFMYAACFSFAYISLSAATGALILFGSVQFTMIIYSVLNGQRLTAWQMLGFVMALVGLGILFLPSATTPDILGGLLMMGAGIAWGAYSIMGKTAGDPTLVTSGNFIRAGLMSGLLLLLSVSSLVWDLTGVVLAIVSGVIASGVGYAIWYAVLPHHATTTSASVQLSVPVITTVLGVSVLGEELSIPMVIASGAILGGIYLVINRIPR